jgi:hypothetical protein
MWSGLRERLSRDEHETCDDREENAKRGNCVDCACEYVLDACFHQYIPLRVVIKSTTRV